MCRDPQAFVSAYRDVPTAQFVSGSSATRRLYDAVGHNESVPSSQGKATATRRERLAVQPSQSERGWASTGAGKDRHGPGPRPRNAAMQSRGTKQGGTGSLEAPGTAWEPSRLLRGQATSLAEVAGTSV